MGDNEKARLVNVHSPPSKSMCAHKFHVHTKQCGW